MCDNIQHILTLGLDTMERTPMNIFNMVAPFANEIANVLTLSGIVPRLYPNANDGKLTDSDLLKKAVFDVIALTGIVSNVAIYTNKYDYKLGVAKGILFIIFTFVIPNIFMDNILDHKLLKNHKLLAGLAVIYLLDLSINFLFCKIKKYFNKEDENKQNENKQNENKQNENKQNENNLDKHYKHN